MTEIISRKEALAKGLKRYFTGKPCAKGHEAERYVVDAKCIACRAEKQVGRFGRLSPEKREAIRERNRASYARDPDAVNKRNIDWREKNPEKVKAMLDAYREKNADQVRARNAEWYEKNKDRSAVTRAAWREANPAMVSLYRRNRRALDRGAPGSHTAADVERIHEAQKGKCACCRKKVGGGYHVDHIVPLSRGGSNWPANLQILCPSCNLSKGGKDPIKFAQELGRLL